PRLVVARGPPVGRQRASRGGFPDWVLLRKRQTCPDATGKLPWGAVPRVATGKRLCWRRVRRTWHMVVDRGALADATMVSRAVRAGDGCARDVVLWVDESARSLRRRARGAVSAQVQRVAG